MKKQLLALWLGIALLFGYGAESTAATVTGTVWTWGYNSSGQLGNGTVSQTPQPNPAAISGVSSVVAVTGGLYHSLAAKADGTVWAWGKNNTGQVGDGTGINQSTPVQVIGLTGVIAAAAGFEHSLALKADGTVWSWGKNYFGQLGDGTGINQSTPVQISGLAGITAIAAGDDFSLAVKSDGTVWAWGQNNVGQLGNNISTYELTPVQINGLAGVIAVAGGFGHGLALKSDGTVWAWGENRYGKLGDGSNTNQPTPIQVHDLADPSGYLTGIIAIAAGEEHSLAAKADGTVRAWGNGYNGQLGDGSTTERWTPVQVSGLTGVVALTAGAGAYHSRALKSDGAIWAWGRNQYAELGDGTLTQRLTAVQVINLSNAGGVGAMGGGSDHGLAIIRPYIDLIASALNVTLSGNNLVIEDAVSNQGTGDSTVPFTTSYYLSSNTLYDTSDILLCSRNISALAVGVTNTAS
ncbi:MAG: hypothetical protein Q7S51_00630, partial [Gallionellaceae bacterium]|nr:hypothetical protein [Gallionellaceae bacterium]